MAREPVAPKQLIRIDPAEWRWAVGWSVGALLLTSLPYLYGALLSTPQSQFSGLVLGVEDGNSYLARIRLGASGAWQLHLFYTSEPHPGAYLMPFYLVLGKLARLVNSEPVVAFHAARLACGLLLLLSVYCFAAFFTAARAVRRLTLWLVGLGSGLGWLVLLTGQLAQVGLPLDFYSPEAFAFHALLGLPHVSLALSSLLWGIVLAGMAWEQQNLRYAFWAGLALTVTALAGAFYIGIAAAVLGSGLVLRAIRRRSTAFVVAELRVVALALMMPALIVAYNVYVFTGHPVYQVWAAQNQILSPRPLHYVLSFGPLLVLAVLGGYQEWRRNASRSLLLIGWCLVLPLLAYFPFALQRRMTLGGQVALTILAGLALWRSDEVTAAQGQRHGWVRRLGRPALIALLSISNLIILVGMVQEVSRQSPPVFIPDWQVAAAEWLGQHATTEQVVLASYSTGNYLPTRMPARVFLGHDVETVHAVDKQAMVHRFYSSEDEAFRRKMLAAYNINYVYYGPHERALGSFIPAQAPYLKLVYDNTIVQIYRVVLEENP